MGLKLERTVRGIDCDYWTVIRCLCRYDQCVSRVWLGLFINESHRLENIKNYLEIETFNIPNIDLERSDIYPIIKLPRYEIIEEGQDHVQVNPFYGAQDC